MLRIKSFAPEENAKRDYKTIERWCHRYYTFGLVRAWNTVGT
jgi:hypothetical protein